MPQAIIDDLTLEYETFGNATDPAMLLIMGLGSQLIQWPTHFCQQLADRGHFVIRYDHRDIGLSSRMDHLKLPNIPWVLIRRRLGLQPKIPYHLHDLATDALALLDYLHIDKAHLIGVSMGGMIAQIIAIHFPARAASLTSIMSTTGNPQLPKATSAAQTAMAASLKRKSQLSFDDKVSLSMNGWKTIGSPAFPVDNATLKTQCEAVLRRGHHPPGIGRHLLACLCAADRRAQLQQLSLPTLVIHGSADPLMPLACGEDTATNIPHSELYIIDGMGHDLPEAVLPQLIEKISSLTQASR